MLLLIRAYMQDYYTHKKMYVLRLPWPCVEYPSCRHTTVASLVPQESSHTVPHILSMQISTLPSFAMLPPASCSWPFVQGAIHKMTVAIELVVLMHTSICLIYLHNSHQHQQSGGSCVTRLDCWGTLAAGWNLRYTEHHPVKFVLYRYQSGHCLMPYQLHVQAS